MTNNSNFVEQDQPIRAEQYLAAQQEYAEAKQFDPNDPLFGLTKEELSGPKLSRRSVMRLLAAAGALTLTDVLVGCAAPASESGSGDAAGEDGGGAEGESAAGGSGGGELVCGWAGTAEITTLDPAQINQVLQFQIASNVLSGLTHINPDLTAEGDLQPMMWFTPTTVPKTQNNPSTPARLATSPALRRWMI